MADHIDPGAVLDKTTEAVIVATEAVQATTDSIAGAIEEGRQPGGALDRLSRLTRDAPLRSLAIAFIIGVLLTRRQ